MGRHWPHNCHCHKRRASWCDDDPGSRSNKRFPGESLIMSSILSPTQIKVEFGNFSETVTLFGYGHRDNLPQRGCEQGRC